jgi:hypothetical protein
VSDRRDVRVSDQDPEILAMKGDMERAFIDLLGNIQKAAEKGGTSWPALVRIVEEVYRLQVQERDRLKRTEQEQKELAWAEANS